MRYRIIDGGVGVYYYKKETDGTTEYIEECVYEKERLPLNVARISESEYRRLWEELTSGGESASVDRYQEGYEQALLDMAEVGI